MSYDALTDPPNLEMTYMVLKSSSIAPRSSIEGVSRSAPNDPLNDMRGLRRIGEKMGGPLCDSSVGVMKGGAKSLGGVGL